MDFLSASIALLVFKSVVVVVVVVVTVVLFLVVVYTKAQNLFICSKQLSWQTIRKKKTPFIGVLSLLYIACSISSRRSFVGLGS